MIIFPLPLHNPKKKFKNKLKQPILKKDKNRRMYYGGKNWKRLLIDYKYQQIVCQVLETLVQTYSWGTSYRFEKDSTRKF